MIARARATSMWLVRHTATSWTGVRWCGRADPPLTPAGREAAAAVGRELEPEIPAGALVVTNPARRARETASAIAAALGARVHVLDELIEVDVGLAEGLTWSELSARQPDLAAAISAGGPVDWPGGESATQVADRAAVAAERLAAIASGRPAVVVSHGAFLHALAGVLGAPADRIPLDAGAVLRIHG